jgi:hypothetical protein
MEWKDIIVTVENHKEYNPEYQEWNKEKALHAHTSLNEFLDYKLGSRKLDWGGRYASFLDKMGIDSNSENGWWSINAVRHENIKAFLDYETNDEFMENYHIAHEKISKIKGFKHSYFLVTELINALI